MSLATNALNVASASELEPDKIVGILTGSYAASSYTDILGGYLYRKWIPHSFGRPVFCEMSWSVDGVNYIDSGSSVGNGSQAALAYADSSNIYILTTSNAGTLSYKVIATWIDNYDNTNPLISPILNTTSKFYYDSRSNIPKILSSAPVTISGTGSLPIAHGLSYAPRFKGYFESLTGQVWPLISGGTGDIWLYDAINQMECSAVIDTTNVTLSYIGPVSSRKLWYRIYADQ